MALSSGTGPIVYRKAYSYTRSCAHQIRIYAQHSECPFTHNALCWDTNAVEKTKTLSKVAVVLPTTRYSLYTECIGEHDYLSCTPAVHTDGKIFSHVASFNSVNDCFLHVLAEVLL
jgi:hypothetical protein